MRIVINSFNQMIRQIKQNPMLLIIVLMPLFIGIIFHFFIPMIESIITEYLVVDTVIAPYYELLDICLLLFTPSLFGYVVAMVMLEEIDEHLISYFAVTPLKKEGYLLSRLGITGVISLLISIVIAYLFGLSEIKISMLFHLAIVASMQGVGNAMFIVSLSSNKVEGIAIGKIVSLFILGAVVPYSINNTIQYFFTLLPTFWIAKTMHSGNHIYILIAILLVFLWGGLLIKRFMRKLF